MSSMPVISRWTRLPMRLPHWSEAFSVLHVEGGGFRIEQDRDGNKECAEDQANAHDK